MKRRTSSLAVALLVSACASNPRTPSPEPAPAPTGGAPVAPTAATPDQAAPPVRLDADTKTTTAAGATFEAPKGWFMRRAGETITLEAPERDLTLTFFEAREKDTERAIALAWARTQPGFSRKPKTTAKPPPRDGWDEIVQIVYETTAAEARNVVAIAWRKGETTYVALIDGTSAAMSRRGANLSTAVASFRAPGVEEESFAGKKANELDAKKLEAFEKFIEDARVKANVPGVAVAVVQNRKIVWERGFGVRTLGQKDPVTPNTLFMIGSITKPLTSLMMAKLVDEGRFSWDTPVVEVFPKFTLGDPDATKKLAMRHTVCACTGLPRQDMTFFFGWSKATPESRVDEMKTLKPTTAFGETFQYSNLMVSAGGYLAAHAADPKRPLGPAYDAAMQSRVLDPIGMKSSTFDFSVAKKREHASPHAMTTSLEPRAMPVSIEGWLPSIRPAGGLWSSAHDIARWVAVELGGGKTLEGKEVVSAANLAERKKPMARISEKSSYGLALIVERYAGVEVVSHNGSTTGFNTLAMWLPEHDTGLVVLTNLNGAGALLDATRRRFFELLFDGKEEASQNFSFALDRRAKAFAAEFAKLETTPDEEWVSKLAGEWKSPVLGKITIRVADGRGVVDAGEWKSTFGRIAEAEGSERLVLLDPPFAGLSVLVKSTGPDTTLALEVGQEKYAFTR